MSLTPDIPGTYEITFEWSSSFNSQHDVASYNVSVFPDPLNCTNNQTSPTTDYICAGLQPETAYYIALSAITGCRDQEGERSSITIELPLAPQMTSEVVVQPTYDQNNILREVFVRWREVVSVGSYKSVGCCVLHFF